MRANSLEVIYLQIDEVVPYGNASRVHDAAMLRKLSRSIERFGQVVPIIVDPDRVIVDGHAIHAAMRELGAEQIAVVVVAGRTEPELRGLRLALNRIPLDSKWDHVRLSAGAEFSALVSLSFDVELTGFELLEIDTILEPDGARRMSSRLLT